METEMQDQETTSGLEGIQRNHDSQDKRKQKKQVTECAVCMERSSLRLNWCNNGCCYNICHDCFFDSCYLVHTTGTLDDIYTKCIYCREYLPTRFRIADILKKRKRYARVIKHRDYMNVLALIFKEKIQGVESIGLSYISQYVQGTRVPERLVLPRMPSPSFGTGQSHVHIAQELVRIAAQAFLSSGPPPLPNAMSVSVTIPNNASAQEPTTTESGGAMEMTDIESDSDSDSDSDSEVGHESDIDSATAEVIGTNIIRALREQQFN